MSSPHLSSPLLSAFSSPWFHLFYFIFFVGIDCILYFLLFFCHLSFPTLLFQCPSEFLLLHFLYCIFFSLHPQPSPSFLSPTTSKFLHSLSPLSPLSPSHPSFSLFPLTYYTQPEQSQHYSFGQHHACIKLKFKWTPGAVSHIRDSLRSASHLQ